MRQNINPDRVGPADPFSTLPLTPWPCTSHSWPKGLCVITQTYHHVLIYLLFSLHCLEYFSSSLPTNPSGLS